jgi:hypothetical protein
MPDAQLELASVVPAQPSGAALATTTATVGGTLRGSGVALKADGAVVFVTGESGLVREVAVLLDEAHVAAIAGARRG